MHPVAALRIVLQNELVKRQILADVVKPLLALLQVAIDTEVNGLPLQVLRVIDTANGLVQGLAAKAGANLDGFLHRNAQRLQDIRTQINQVDHLLRIRLVVDSFPFGCFTCAQLFHCKVHGYWCTHINLRLWVLYRVASFSPSFQA